MKGINDKCSRGIYKVSICITDFVIKTKNWYNVGHVRRKEKER